MISANSLTTIKQQVTQIIDSLNSTANLAAKSPLNVRVLQQSEKSLKALEFALQFELLKAQESEDWPLIDALSDTLETCQKALNAVRAGLLKTIVLGSDHAQIISELKGIRQNINQAVQSEKVLGFCLSVARVLIKVVK